MEVLLQLKKPSAHWIGMCNLIAQSDALRDDIILRVNDDGISFFEEHGDRVQIPVMTQGWSLHAADTLAGKLAIFERLHREFSKPLPPAPARARLQRPPRSFLPGGAIKRAVRFG
jgi:hypothetical protein